MNFLADTHILIRSLINPEILNAEIKEILLNENNNIYYSQISLWEISIKFTLGKLVLKGMIPEQFYEEIENSFFFLKD